MTQMHWPKLPDLAAALVALAGPALLTLFLRRTGAPERNYVFLYLGLVTLVAVWRGLWPSLVAAGASFLLVDYFFVPPIGTFTIAEAQDLVNLVVFFGAAGLVGALASNRRRAQMHAETLSRQLRQANADLIRLNREQAEAAQAAIRLARSEQQIQVLQRIDRDRRDLFANISHELRTPISSILTDSTNMLRTESLAGSSRDRLEAIGGEARRLNRLVGDMLDMARIEGGALQLMSEPVRVGDAVAAAAERLQRGSPGRQVEWSPDDAAAMVLADWDRLGQVFDNLLANADRYAPPGTSIMVAVGQEDARFVTIRVIDAGPGVPLELRDRLFNRFVKGGSDSPGGTGLGLAITRGLVEAHGGRIALEDRPQGGTSFRFSLPQAET